MHFSSIFTFILLPLAVAKNGCVQYACKDLLVCGSGIANSITTIIEGDISGKFGKDTGKLTSSVKPNPEDSVAFREKNCNEPGMIYKSSSKVDYYVWRSAHKGNFYIDRSSTTFQIRVRGWCEWVKEVDC